MSERNFLISDEDDQRSIFVERLGSGEEVEYEITVEGDYGNHWAKYYFESEAQAKEFVTKFAALIKENRCGGVAQQKEGVWEAPSYNEPNVDMT